MGGALAGGAFLAACGVTPPMPAPTEMPTGTAVPLIPTPTPEIPTVTPTATEVPDPLAGPKPPGEGITLDTTRHEWMRTVNGEVQYFSPEIQDWTVPHVIDGTYLGGIPLVNIIDLKFKSMPMYIDFQIGVQGPYIQSLDSSVINNAPSFPNIFIGELAERYYGKDIRKITVDEWKVFMSGIEKGDGSIAIPFTTPDGVNHIWKLGTDTGYKFYGVRWEDADPATHPGFYETWDEIQYKSLTYRWKVSTDTQGNLVVLGAVKDPVALSNVQLIGWILHPMEAVLKYDQLPAQLKGWGFPTYPSPLVTFASKSPAPGAPPWLKVVQSPTP